MKDKRGFTLIELITIIILLGVIMTISVVSITTISSKVKEKQYESLETTIKLEAEKYASETGAKTLLVQNLIDEGLIEADGEDNLVYDPRDKSVLNCRVIRIKDSKASVTEDNPILEGNICDVSILEEAAIALKYRFLDEEEKDAKPVLEDEWINKDVILSVSPTGALKLENFDEAEKTYKWISPLAPDDVKTTAEYTLKTTYLKDLFAVTVTLNDTNYNVNQRVLIDQEKPNVFDIVDLHPASWEKHKTLNFKINDVGSGVESYGFSFDKDTEPENWINVSSSNLVELKEIEIDLEEMEDGEKLYIWAKDGAGNINNGENNTDFTLNVDSSAADKGISIDYSPKRPTYAKTVTLTGTAEDSKSGIVAYAFSDKEIDKDSNLWKDIDKTNEKITKSDNTVANKDGTYFFCVKDEVQNIACKDIYVDSTDNNVDEVKISLASSDYLKATLNISAKDYRSGISAYCISQNANSCTNYQSILGSPDSLSTTYEVNKNGTYYLFIKDALGNIESSYSKNGNSGGTTVSTIDEEAAEGGISMDFSPKVPIYGKVATLTGSARDTKSGLVAYAFSITEINASSSSWISIPATNATITQTNNTLAYLNGTYFFCVKDAAQNVKCVNTRVNSIDNDGPVYQSGGVVSKNSISSSTWKDVSNPVTVYYTATTSTSTPSASAITSTSQSFSFSANNTTYYVWAKAVDKLGNYTIRNMGSYKTCSEGTWTTAACGPNGYKTETRYNECLGKTETRDTTIACEYPLACYTEYDECQSNNRQTRQCPVKYAGYTKYVTEYKSCVYAPVYDATWMCKENSVYWGCNGGYVLVSGWSDIWGCVEKRVNFFFVRHECWACATQYDNNDRPIAYKRYGTNQCKKAG